MQGVETTLLAASPLDPSDPDQTVMQTRTFFSVPLLLALLFAFLLDLPTTLPAAAQGPQDAPRAEGVADAATLRAAEARTLRLATLAERLPQARGLQRDALLEELRETALARRDLLATLIEESPGEVLRLALPDRIRRGMPDEVQGLIEERLELEGELTVFHVDGEDPADSRYAHLLETRFDERISLHFSGDMPGLLTGTEVRARGVVFPGLETQDNEGGEGAVVIGSEDDPLQLLACCDGTGGTAVGSVEPVPNTFGEQRTLVLLVNFQDLQEEPWTVDEVSSLFFGTVSDFYFESSYGQAWLTGDVLGWYTLPLDARCERTEIQRLAEEAAIAAGVDLSAYGRLVYAWPQHTCGWGGLADVGASPSHAYLNGALNLRIVAHELGHNFGLYHSHGLNCNDGVLGTDCQYIDYGDRMDVMGARPAHFNAFQKERLGWLGYGTSPEIAVVTTDGTYEIAPYEFSGSVANALKIPRGIPHPDTGAPTWFYLEYRQPLGFDGLLNDVYLNWNNIFGGVLTHHETEGDPGRSLLLDMTPNSTETTYTDLDDSALMAGLTYTDSESGIAITTHWADGNGATVNVAFGESACVAANPTVEISPSESQWVEPGTLVTYGINITDNDGGSCPSVTFGLSATMPAGWSWSIADPSLTLDPGTSASTTMTVISPDSAADGFYDVTASAVNLTDSNLAATATATYVVDSTTQNSPPHPVDDSAETTDSSPVDVLVLVNDFDPDGDPLAVTDVSQPGKGVITFTADGVVHYTPDPKAKGNDTFSYTVTDGLATSTASITISIRNGGSGSGGTGNGKGNGKNKN